MSIKNTSEVANQSEKAGLDLKVHSHFNNSRLVELQVGLDPEKDRIIVDGNDLKVAIDNCMNVRKDQG